MAIAGTDSRNIGQQQRQFQKEELRAAVRALLMTPLMSPDDDDFPAVRRQADALRDWFGRETGWMLQIEHEGARLYKRPADLASTTRGLPFYDRRRYVLLCLACAVLERADPQITLRLLGERLLQFAAEPTLAASGFSFTLGSPHERRELVAVCRTLLELGVVQRVAGDEDAFVHSGGEQADALYDVQRRVLVAPVAIVHAHHRSFLRAGSCGGSFLRVVVTLGSWSLSLSAVRLRALTCRHAGDVDVDNHWQSPPAARHSPRLTWITWPRLARSRRR